MTQLSIIIPVGEQETAHIDLLYALQTLPTKTEIILVRPEGSDITVPNDLTIAPRLLSSKKGRAEQMNNGAKAATGQFFWFVHADSRLAANTLSSLHQAMKAHPDRLIYFDLRFLADASPLMPLNALGVRLRSRLLQTPFGDQGFCLHRDIFDKINGFPEGEAYGEDHLFVWRARQQGVKLFPTGTTLFTSARKYKKNGWLRTTLLHQYLWLKQAWPQWRKLHKQRP